MILLLLIPILVSGYIVFLKHPKFFFKLHRYDGQLLYIKTIALGLLCSSIAILIVSGIEYFFDYVSINNFLNQKYFKGIDAEYRSKLVWLLYVLVISSLVGYLWGFSAKLKLYFRALMQLVYKSLYALQEDAKRHEHYEFTRIDKVALIFSLILYFKNKSKSIKKQYKVNLMQSLLNDSPMDEIFCQSYDKKVPLMLTLDDRKMYVGTVINLGEPTESQGMDQEIRITPFLSGYRDKNTHEVSLPTIYPQLDTELSLVIRQDKIVTATVFNNDLYDSFSRKSKSKKSFYDTYSSMISKRI